MTGLTAYTQGSNTSVLTTQLNSLPTNNAYCAASGDQDNSTNLDFWADFLLTITFGTNPTAGSTIDLFIIPSLDGTVFSDGTTAVVPSGPLYCGYFQLRAVTSAQNIILPRVPLPPGEWRAVLFNNASGQTPASSGNTLVFRSYKTA